MTRVGRDGFFQLRYSQMIPLLVEAIKEQQTIIESQTARIEALEAQRLP